MQNGGALWGRFLSFLDCVTRCAETHQSAVPGEARAWLQDLTATARALPRSEDCEHVLWSYFDQPPAHTVAVNTLDHTQFLLPVVLPLGVSFPLRDVLGTFSHVPQAYGEVWLSLLDVAEHAAPAGTLNCAAGRDYIRGQLGHTTAASSSFDSLFGGVLSAFPGFQECMTQMMTAQASSSNREDIGGMMDQMQRIIMGPVMNSIRSSNPNAPDIGPAMEQIMEGFRNLNAAIVAGSKPNPEGDVVVD